MMKDTNFNMKTTMMIVKTKKGLEKIPMEKILYVECVNFYCILVLEDGRRLDYSCSLRHMEERLQELRFSKISRNHLVNLDYVTMVKRYNSRKWSVLMSDQTEFPIAYRRLARFKKMFLDEM